MRWISQKIKAGLGWSPKESLKSGIRKTIDWYLSNTEWLEAIKEQPTYADWMTENYGQRGGAQ
jgi:dTDP-glucose 4,6-dehydratase